MFVPFQPIVLSNSVVRSVAVSVFVAVTGVNAPFSAVFVPFVIVTAPGREVDFVSRFFGPSFGIPEDPVTGSAHCTLAPYWSARLGKKTLTARQLSPRGGDTAKHPQINRWEYANFIVYFEHSHVIHAVLNTPAGNNTNPADVN